MGRYIVRDAGDEDALRVLVITELGAPERRVLNRKRSRKAPSEPDPAPVQTTRATLVRGRPLASDAEAKEHLARGELAVDEELAILNRVLHLHRVASANPAIREVARDDALVVRVGVGLGEQVAEGRWEQAIEPGSGHAGRVRRVDRLRPQERLAALLGGRDAALASEELTLRARADWDAGRYRESALQLRIALEAAIAELEAWRERGDLGERVAELRDERGVVGAAANSALRGGLDDATVEEVERVLLRVEAALRARALGGLLG